MLSRAIWRQAGPISRTLRIDLCQSSACGGVLNDRLGDSFCPEEEVMTKSRTLALVQAFGLVIWFGTSLSIPASAETQQTINGFLFSKLAGIHYRSEGPIYFLQKFDYTEVEIAKHAPLEGDDANLHARLGTKVSITGDMEGGSFRYTSIKRCPVSVEGCEIQYYHPHH
jgi:hypothetical protein